MWVTHDDPIGWLFKSAKNEFIFWFAKSGKNFEFSQKPRYALCDHLKLFWSRSVASSFALKCGFQYRSHRLISFKSAKNIDVGKTIWGDTTYTYLQIGTQTAWRYYELHPCALWTSWWTWNLCWKDKLTLVITVPSMLSFSSKSVWIW